VDSERSRRVFCFLTSLAIHAVLLYLALNIASPVKVYPVKEEITNILIVPPERLFLPQRYEEFMGKGEFDEFLVAGITRQSRSFQKKKMQKTEKGTMDHILLERKGGVSRDLLQSERSESRESEEQNIPQSGPFSGFKLRIPQNIVPQLKQAAELNLSPYIERAKKAFSGIDKERFMKSLSEYTYTDLSKAPPARSGSSLKRFGKSRGSRRGEVLFNAKGYDITPWATEVVNKIQANWIIPSSQRMSAKGRVSILVKIERNGEISHMEIVESSDVSELDHLALNAVNSSLPFPSLPDEFPLKILEAYFVFQYNE